MARSVVQGSVLKLPVAQLLHVSVKKYCAVGDCADGSMLHQLLQPRYLEDQECWLSCVSICTEPRYSSQGMQKTGMTGC